MKRRVYLKQENSIILYERRYISTNMSTIDVSIMVANRRYELPCCLLSWFVITTLSEIGRGQLGRSPAAASGETWRGSFGTSASSCRSMGGRVSCPRRVGPARPSSSATCSPTEPAHGPRRPPRGLVFPHTERGLIRVRSQRPVMSPTDNPCYAPESESLQPTIARVGHETRRVIR